MATREQRATAEALVWLDDVRDQLSELVVPAQGKQWPREKLMRAAAGLAEAAELLETDVARGTGLSVDAAAEYLDVSAPTVREWMRRGVLERKADTKPAQIDRESARTVHRALAELRACGQDRDWLTALVDYLHDARDRRSESVRKGLDELARGELEPAAVATIGGA